MISHLRLKNKLAPAPNEHRTDWCVREWMWWDVSSLSGSFWTAQPFASFCLHLLWKLWPLVSFPHPATTTTTVWAVKWLSSSSNTANAPFQPLVWKHFRMSRQRGSLKHLVQRSAHSPLFLLPLNPPLKREGGPSLSNSQRPPSTLLSFCPPPQQQFLLQKP